MRQIQFFATPKDIVPVLHRFEASFPVKYVSGGARDCLEREVYLTSALLPEPGVATHETGSLSRWYLVMHRDSQHQSNVSVTRNGVKRWNLFETENEGSASLALAGIRKSGALLPGSLATTHKSGMSQQIMKCFLAALKAEDFSKVDLWWLGREALRTLETGGRLAKTAEQSPPEFDLKLPR